MVPQISHIETRLETSRGERYGAWLRVQNNLGSDNFKVVFPPDISALAVIRLSFKRASDKALA